MFWRHNYLGVSWAVLILFLLLLPGDSFGESVIPFADEAIHTILFGVLFFLLTVGFIKQNSFTSIRRKAALKVFVLSLIYGIILEVLQELLIPDRSIELSDILFDGIGLLVGWGIFITAFEFFVPYFKRI